MSRTLCAAALTCLVLCYTSQTGLAGPIQWSLRGDIEPSRAGGEFYLGQFTRPTEQGEATETVYAFGRMPETLMPVGSGSMDHIDLAVQSKQGFRFDTGPLPGAPTTSAVVFDVQVTDAASGETGHLSMSLGAFLLTGLPQSDVSELGFTGEASKTLVLGGNRYDVRLWTGDTDSATHVYADLNVSPASATPEPGTLALAGLGVGALGLVRRFRRAA